MGYINAIVRDPASESGSITPVPELTLELARAWAAQHFADRGRCVWNAGRSGKSCSGWLIGPSDSRLALELKHHGGVRPDLVVTRMPILVTVLRERGIIDDSTPVLSNATRNAVKGKHVLGLLPNYLASMAASITEIPMRLTNEDYMDMQRGKLSLARMRACAGDPITYRVERFVLEGSDG